MGFSPKVRLQAVQQHPAEKEFWGKKLWRMARQGVETEFHAKDREEAMKIVRGWFPDAEFYKGGRGRPPINPRGRK
jgi:hypothetical protein